MRDELKIIVAIHKPYPVLNDKTYLPVHAGAALAKDIGFQSDAFGVARKNRVASGAERLQCCVFADWI